MKNREIVIIVFIIILIFMIFSSSFTSMGNVILKKSTKSETSVGSILNKIFGIQKNEPKTITDTNLEYSPIKGPINCG